MTRREAIKAAIALNPRVIWFSDRVNNNIVTMSGESIAYTTG